MNSFVTVYSFVKGGGCTQECPVPSCAAVLFYAPVGVGAIPWGWDKPTPPSADRKRLPGRIDLKLGLKDGSGKGFGKWEMKTVLGIGTMEVKNQKCFRRKLAHWIRAWGLHSQAELFLNSSVAV